MAFFNRGRPYWVHLVDVFHSKSSVTLYLCWRVLIALDFAQSISRSIEDELRRIVTKEALSHVDHGLHIAALGCLVDD